MHPVKSYLGEGATPLWLADRVSTRSAGRTSRPRRARRTCQETLLTTADDARCFTRHTTDMHSANGQQPRRCGVWLSVSGRKGPATVAAVRALAWPDRALEWHEARWHTALSNCGPPKEHRLCALALVLPASRVLQPTPGPHLTLTRSRTMLSPQVPAPRVSTQVGHAGARLPLRLARRLPRALGVGRPHSARVTAAAPLLP